jgi:4-amino-4-deoxy-L-arabinose transferase-like glycosyltransferase
MRRYSGRFSLVVIVATLLGFNFGSRLLLTNDDTRFPVMARDVLVNGHWLLPALPDGTPHLMKPPLVVWLIALASWPGGAVSVRTAVLPSLLEAIGVVLLTYWLGRRLFDPDAGVVAGLTVATTVGVYSMAHSSMPDMAQLVAATGAMAVYVASQFGDKRPWLVALYGIIGVGSLPKGAAGFIPLAIVLVDTITTHGRVGLKRLVSIPGWIVLAALAVPWWIVAAVSGGRARFVQGVVVTDQLLSYFWRPVWGWRTLTEPFVHAVTVLLPWGLLLPFTVRRAFREADPEAARRVRLLLVWLATAFVLVAVSGRQRDRYYLPLCPATALLTGWWYSTLAWRWRARAFAGAWIAVVVGGVGLVTWNTPRFNATTDLRDLRATLARRSVPLFAVDVQDLAVSFNLDRAVVNDRSYRTFAAHAQHGQTGYLIISDRALSAQTIDPCMRRVASGVVTGRPFTVLEPTGCDDASDTGRHGVLRGLHGDHLVPRNDEGATGGPVAPRILERPTGFEPATSSLGSLFHATTCVTVLEKWRTRRSVRCVMTRGDPRDPKERSLEWSLGGLDDMAAPARSLQPA